MFSSRLRSYALAVGVFLCAGSALAMPPDYKGKPFSDPQHSAGPAAIPGVLQAALYDLGGEGVAYHDSDVVNHGSGELNHTEFVSNGVPTKHCRPGTAEYICYFREKESIDTSYTKDFADFNHPNLFVPPQQQLYVGWQEEGEWANYTVRVAKPGVYKVTALYANGANTVKFDVDGKPAGEGKLPVETGGPHNWNKAEIGTVTFPAAGLQVLTIHFPKLNNLAYFEFVPAAPPAKGTAKR